MAEIFATRTNQVPSTPTKSILSAQKADAAPQYSPGAVPQYAPRGDQLSSSSTTEAPDTSKTMPLGSTPYGLYSIDNILPVHSADPRHPVLPIGDIMYDIRNHLKCYAMFNHNIETLIEQWLTMKKDLDSARTELAHSQRAWQRERDDRETAERECDALSSELKDARLDLSDAQSKLKDSQAKLALAISQLAEASTKLEASRNDLRSMRRERDAFAKQSVEKQRELEFYIERNREFERALQQANHGENAANDRNTRLTKLLFEIEAQKAAIERRKDHSDGRVRVLLERIEELERHMRDNTHNNPHVSALQRELEHLKAETGQDDSLNNPPRTREDARKAIESGLGGQYDSEPSRPDLDDDAATTSEVAGQSGKEEAEKAADTSSLDQNADA